MPVLAILVVFALLVLSILILDDMGHIDAENILENELFQLLTNVILIVVGIIVAIIVALIILFFIAYVRD